MKIIFGLLCCLFLIEYSEQKCTGCPCGECPLYSLCYQDTPCLLCFLNTYCDGICMNCARYIAYPCTYCPSGTFCYMENDGSQIKVWCPDCASYPNFCSAPYTYGTSPSSKLVYLASNSTPFQQLPFLKKP